MAAETNLIHLVAIHATASTAAPTLAAKNANIAQATWSTAGFETIGSVELNTDDMDLSGDVITISRLVDLAPVKPARSHGLSDLVYLGGRIEPFTFMCDDSREGLITLDSTVSVASNKAQIGDTLTYRTVAIEVNNLWLDYFPRCVVSVTQMPQGSGADGMGKLQFTVAPTADSTYPGGWYREWKQ